MTDSPVIDAARAAREAFARAMAAAGPFERAPALALAVSGGADSLALALLADEWARARDGTVIALTVDHRLRPESAAEAAAVGRLLAARGIAHRMLVWQGAKPASAIQATARAARYRLLEDWCRAAGVLHLLLGHQREDQAETFLLRLARGSGPDGLSAMAPVSESAAVRRLRPLLEVGRATLETFLRGEGIAWIDDPTNRDPAFARVRMRQALPALAVAGADAESLAAAAARFGTARAALEEATAALLARALALDPRGFAMLDRPLVAAAPAEIAVRALARVVATIGGKEALPRRDAVARLHAGLIAGSGANSGATLGGCHVSARAGRVLVCRELRGVAETALVPGDRILWDGRFAVEAAAADLPDGLRIAPLGAAGWAEVVAAARARAADPAPVPARATLPALFDRFGLLAAPPLGYRRDGPQGPEIARISFRPRHSLSGAGFFVAQVV